MAGRMRSVVMVAACLAATATAQQLVKIGDLQTLQHGVSGEVYAVDENHIRIKHFNYDGTGPDAFFWIGTEGSPDSTDETKTAILAYPYKGKHFVYRDESAPVLLRAEDEDVVLTLPPEIKVSSVKWISVWCRKFSVDFGHLIFPEGLRIPEESELHPPRVPPSSSTAATRFPGHEDDDDEHNTIYPEPEPESEPEPTKTDDKWGKTTTRRPAAKPRSGGAAELRWSLAAVSSSLLLSLVFLF